MRLARSFFEQKTLTVAKNLLGCFLIRQIGQKKIIARIIETEAYCGPYDLASHASKGRTKRTEVMFGPAGYAYVYLVYGMYYCLNVVTGRVGYPAAVLIRGIELIHGLKFSNFKLPKQTTNNKLRTTKIIGPGKVCRALTIDKRFNDIDLIKGNRLYIVRVADDFNRRTVKKLPRVGVDYAGKYKDKKWRFVLE